ncbi:flavin reductase family protein [Novosphingobium sp. PASSN1]|uniref:flavin reductase family protein n=1 Tax=Novosphingobium sp. PASSN1 TaxID=2015561 RepID=UPI000BCCD29C|nr:flavin reductase family protein [Novosphingobium sp. PASSN1]OYU34773.1 MAG: flavin reductase domain-containing protein [Novosphingobium sp. PASSN1]
MNSEFVSPEQDLAHAFKQAMRRLAASVTIITTTNSDGEPVGMTATAVTSLSAEPPSLLACVNRSASIHSSFSVGRRFCVNLLGQNHSDLSFAFGGKVGPSERFGHGDWVHAEVPYLADAQVNFACMVDGMFDYGTHSIIVGRLDGIRLAGEFGPLVYGDGRFITTSIAA